MSNVFTPILVIPAVPHDGGIKFLHRNGQLDIGPEMADEVWKILAYCNGYNDIPAVAELSDLPVDEVSQIINQLVELEIVVDSKEQFIHFHRIRNYPASYICNLSQDEVGEYTKSARKPVKPGVDFMFNRVKHSLFDDVLPVRRSCRNFSDEKLSLDQIGSICHYAYSIKDHAVPSGGALYPIRIYVLVEKPQNEIPVGYYEYDAENDKLVLFNDVVDEEQLKYCFNQEEMPFGSSVQIVIAADLKRQPYKYSNRGYMLTLVEVGHVAENVSLFCAEQGLGACELGGIQDEPLKAELELEDFIYPIIAIPVGYRSEMKHDSIDKIRYVENHSGAEHPVERFWTNVFDGNGAFFGATSVYKDGDGNIQYAGATSPAYADAVFKAVIEGRERWLSGQVRSDFIGPAKELKNWANPYDYFPLTKEQAKLCGVKFFDEELPISWTRGQRYDGTTIFVPSDIVYYGQRSSENRIYFGHSSGIAAYSNFAEAEKRAIVELIERDALMRNWYSRKSPAIIDQGILPVHAKKRIAHWAKQDRKMIILEMPSEYGWVFETIIVASEYPCFVSGAAATIDKQGIQDAIHKSIQEAEYNLLLCLENPDDSIMEPEKVLTPSDHGKVYHTAEYATTLAWLWSGETTKSFASIKSRSLDELKVELQTIMLDLSDDGDDLFVVRVLSPKLVQINFGFNSAHYTYDYLKAQPESLMMPHYFA